jgi:hypothetical protein
MNSGELQILLTKPVAAGVAATVIDKYVLGSPDWRESLMFGGAVAIGSLAGDVAGKKLAESQTGVLPVAKGLEGRFIELGITGGAALLVNYKILNAPMYQSEITKKLVAVVAADVAGEYAASTIMGVI